MLEAGGEGDMGPHKRVIMEWTRGIKSRPQVTIGGPMCALYAGGLPIIV